MRIAAFFASLALTLAIAPVQATTVTPAQAASVSQKLGVLGPVFLGSSFDVAVFRGKALTEFGAARSGAHSLSQLLSSYLVFGAAKTSATNFFDHARFGSAGHF